MASVKIGHPWNVPLKAMQDEVQAARRAAAEAGWPEVNGTGVADFFAGRSVLLTGATGFLGRLLLELVLRSCPDVDKVYVLMRPKRGVSVEERMRKAFENALFDRLRAERPGVLEAKVHALAGNIDAPRLGLNDEDTALVCREVSVFFNVAASVRFVDSIANSALTNVRSAQEAVKLAKAMTKLKAMVHVSTAYTNVDQLVVEEKVYPTAQDWRTILTAVERVPDPDTLNVLGPKLLGKQPNSYTFTKALAEQVINEASSEIPVVIVRPSIVIGTYRDPVPGWIDNLYGLAVFWVLVGMGVERVHYIVDPSLEHNIVPGDVVAKTVVLAAWEKAVRQRSTAETHSQVEVVHSVATENLCFSWDEMTYCVDVAADVPMPDAIRYPKVTLTTSKIVYTFWHLILHVGFGALIDLVAVLAGQQPRLLSVYRKMVVGIDITVPFQKQTFKFKDKQQWRLQSLLLPSDTSDYCLLHYLDERNSEETFKDWSRNVLMGIQKYCLAAEYDPEKAKTRIVRLWWFEAAFKGLLLFVFVCVAWRSFC